jgi:hypothetical protein
MAPFASKVFNSYNRADQVAGVIKRAGYKPIFDVWHFRPGEILSCACKGLLRRRT